MQLSWAVIGASIFLDGIERHDVVNVESFEKEERQILNIPSWLWVCCCGVLDVVGVAERLIPRLKCKVERTTN